MYLYINPMEPSWPWSYGSWIYKYLCNQLLSRLILWVRIWIRTRCTALCDKVCQWLATCQWFSSDPPVSSTNKTNRYDITEILLKVLLSSIKQTNKETDINPKPEMWHLHANTFKLFCFQMFYPVVLCLPQMQWWGVKDDWNTKLWLHKICMTRR